MKKIIGILGVIILLGVSGCTLFQKETAEPEVKPLMFATKPSSDTHNTYDVYAGETKLGQAELSLLVENQPDHTVTFTYLDHLQGETFIEISADQDTLQPLQSQAKLKTVDKEMTVKASYDTNQVAYHSISSKGEENWSRQRQGIGYEDNQVYQLLRFLPLQEGYKANFLMETTMMPEQVKMEIVVSEIESITLGEVSYQAYKTELILEGNVHQTLWYQVDEGHQLLKFGSQQVSYILVME